MEDVHWSMTALKWLYSSLKWLPAIDRAGARIKNQLVSSSNARILDSVHTQIVHEARVLNTSMIFSALNPKSNCRKEFDDFCEAVVDTFNALLGKEQQYTCRMMKRYKDGDRYFVKTIGQSKSGFRPASFNGYAKSYIDVSKNSIWASMHPKMNDGRTVWDCQRAFACNDLSKYNTKFQCCLEDWHQAFLSTIAVPIRAPLSPTSTSEMAEFGYLWITSPLKNAFPGLPEIYDFAESTKYSTALQNCPSFHTLASAADSIAGAFLTRQILKHLASQLNDSNLNVQLLAAKEVPNLPFSQ